MLAKDPFPFRIWFGENIPFLSIHDELGLRDVYNATHMIEVRV